MHKRVVPYVHLLLYQCQECAEPVALAVKSDEANLERIDGDFNEVQCKCGWFKKLLGVEAKSHMVTVWGNSANLEFQGHSSDPAVDQDEGKHSIQ